MSGEAAKKVVCAACGCDRVSAITTAYIEGRLAVDERNGGVYVTCGSVEPHDDYHIEDGSVICEECCHGDFRIEPVEPIHPPAHYQIDTSTPGWNTRYVDAVAKEHGWTRAEAQGRIADGGAG